MDRDVLLKAYETHAAEYRLEVQLGWDRMKFFLTLNVGLLAALSGFSGHARVAAAGYLAGALACALGTHIVRKTHSYYQNARDAFKAVEAMLEIPSAAKMATTPGMIGASFLHKLRITTAGVVVLVALGLLDVALAVVALLGAP